MATVIDSLLVRLGFIPDPTGARQFSNQMDSLQSKMAGFFAFVGGMATINSFVDTASQFEQFEVRLTTLQGSAEEAKKSLDWIAEFAAKTPYEMAQVTDAFIKLQAYGLDPVKDNFLESIGNMASAMGKSLDQAVEAIADAINGENERLKEFGIKASKKGETIEYTYNINGEEFKKQAANNAQDIQRALQEIMDQRFIGGMEAMSKTWEGTLSNLTDTWSFFKKKVMEAGIFDSMKDTLNEWMILLIKNKDVIQEWAEAIGTNIMRVVRRFMQIVNALHEFAKEAGISEHYGKILAVAIGLLAASLAAMGISFVVAQLAALGPAFLSLFSPIGLIAVALLALFLIFDDLETFADGGESFLIPFLQDSPLVVAAIGVLITALSALAAQWLMVKARWLQSVFMMVATTIPQIWAMASAWIAANAAMLMASLATIGTVVLVIVAIAALVAAGLWLYENWDEVWNGLGEIVANVVGMVTEQWDAFVNSIIGGWDTVKAAWEKAKAFVGLGDSETTVNATTTANGAAATAYKPNANDVGAKANGATVNQTNNTQINVPTAEAAAQVANSTANNQSKNAMRSANSGVAQ